MNSRSVSVAGLGLVSGLGSGVRHNWERALGGANGIAEIKRFETSNLLARFGSVVDRYPGLSCAERTRKVAVDVVEEALSGSCMRRSERANTGIFIGAPVFDIDWLVLADRRRRSTEDALDLMACEEWVSELGTEIGSVVESSYPAVMVNTACASGASALQLALRCMRRGRFDNAVVVASDATVCPETLTRFALISALSTRNDEPHRASRPFCEDRDGFVMGEGAAALLLQNPRRCRPIARRHHLAQLSGAGDSTDPFHRTRSSPDGRAIIRSMQKALQDAGLYPAAVGYVNAHGTSTPENDRMESLGIRKVFGDQVPPITSNKSQIGHCLTAAGGLEAVLSIMSLLDETIPPTLNYDAPDRELGMRVVTEAEHCSGLSHVLSNSFGFGGQNVSLVFSRCP